MARKKAPLHEVIKSLREALDPPLTAAEFARKIRMDPIRYWRLESGDTRLLADDVVRIADGLGRGVAEIYGEARAS